MKITIETIQDFTGPCYAGIKEISRKDITERDKEILTEILRLIEEAHDQALVLDEE